MNFDLFCQIHVNLFMFSVTFQLATGLVFSYSNYLLSDGSYLLVYLSYSTCKMIRIQWVHWNVIPSGVEEHQKL